MPLLTGARQTPNHEDRGEGITPQLAMSSLPTFGRTTKSTLQCQVTLPGASCWMHLHTGRRTRQTRSSARSSARLVNVIYTYMWKKMLGHFTVYACGWKLSCTSDLLPVESATKLAYFQVQVSIYNKRVKVHKRVGQDPSSNCAYAKLGRKLVGTITELHETYGNVHATRHRHYIDTARTSC